MINKTLITRKSSVMVDINMESTEAYSRDTIFTLLSKMGSYGYTLDIASIEFLRARNVNITKLIDEMGALLHEVTGSSTADSKPFYVNFPTQVEKMSDEELFVNSLIYYVFGVNVSDQTEEARPKLSKKIKLKTIKLVDRDTAKGYGIELLDSTVAFGEKEREDLDIYLNEFGSDLYKEYTNTTNRENKVYLAHKIYSDGVLIEGLDFKEFMTAPTDVLRFIALMQEQDHSLASKLKFKSFRRYERRLILELLDKFDDNKWVDDFARYCNEYKKLSRFIHPFEKANKYVGAQKQLKKCIDDVKVATYNTKVEALIKAGNGVELIKLLSTRPSEFARRLGKVMEVAGAQDAITQFALVAKDVPVHILASLVGYFKGRAKDKKTRMFAPKSLKPVIHVVKNEQAKLDEAVVNVALEVINGAMIEQLKTRDELGKVFIEKALDGIALPLGLRNANKGAKLIARYSRLPIADDVKVLRPFIHWIGRDVDLSATMHDEEFNYKGDCSYYNLNRSNYGMVHSGDFVNAPAPRGASEYVDIDIAKAIEAGVRYVLINVYSYSGESFSEIKDCYCGYMSRDSAKSGEVFEAKTVEHKYDLGNKGTNSIPMIIDLVNREIVWCDLSTGSERPHQNSSRDGVSLETIVEGVMTNEIFSLGELYKAHAIARGTLVETKEEADVVFDMNGIYDFDKIIDEYL